MQMHDPKASSTRSSSTASTASSSAIKSGYHSGNNSQVTSSASNRSTGNNNNNNTSNNNSKSADNNHQRRGKKKSASRDKSQPTNNEQSASVMSNLSSYSLIDDDHIDDQETINVGNLIIDLESDLEKEKIENEQANNSLEGNSKYSNSSLNAPSSTSQLATSAAPSSSTPSSSSTTPSTPTKASSINKAASNHIDQSKSTVKQTNNQKFSKKEVVPEKAANLGGLNNNGHNVPSRTVFKSSADERGELKMKITRETKPGKNEHKFVTSPSRKSPTSSSGGGSSNSGVNSQANNYEEAGTNELSLNPAQASSSISSTKECGTSTSIGTITEPECLGPCEPGTSVTLEGIVWQETDGGILVVNVTWRGKTYVGALLDCTRHDWAPPRLCDSPISDIDAKTSKGVRTKRIVTRSNGIGLDEKNLLQTTGKLRNGKGRRIPPSNESTSCNKKQRETTDKLLGESSTAQTEASAQQADNMASTISETPSLPMNMESSCNIVNNSNNNNQLESPQEPGNNNNNNNNLLDKTGPESPVLIGCNEPNCNKKYRNMNGLQYHHSHAHGPESESAGNQDDCSPQSRDKDPAINDETAPPKDQSGLQPKSMASHQDASSNEEKPYEQQQMRPQQAQKRERSPSPGGSHKLSNVFNPDSMHYNIPEHRPRPNDSPRITAVRNVNPERRDSGSSSSYGSNVPRRPDHGSKSPSVHQKNHSYDSHGHGSSSLPGNPQATNQSSSSSSKSSSHSSKQANPQPPPLPALTEEGMKPSGTSTGPPPAPHQANCFFNPAFLANTFNPYGIPPYFPRHMYDSLTPPSIPTSNAAFYTRFMNDMRIPRPADSPSRLLSPSMPKNVPPFKVDSGAIPPPQIPTSHPLPNLSPMTNPPVPPLPVPPMPPLSMAGVPPGMRLPSPSDSIMPPSSQPPPLPGLNPALGFPGLPGNPMRPLGGPRVPNLVDDPLAKQFPRQF